jgi:two-component system, oxyanion-binding sensor
VLPPPYMVESLAGGQVDGFCVGAPWNSVAVDEGAGRILHFGSEITRRLAEKVLAVRTGWAQEYEAVLMRLMRAIAAAAEYTARPENWEECARLLAAPHRIGVRAEMIERTLSGRLKVSPDGAVKSSAAYLIPGAGAAGRPDPVQAAWLYAQMVRWGQTELRGDVLAEARAVLSPALFDKCFAVNGPAGVSADGIGAFTGPPFDADDIGTYLAASRRD